MTDASHDEALLARIAARIEEGGPARDTDEALFLAFREALEAGRLRAARRAECGTWQVEVRVKQGILWGFRLGTLTDMTAGLAFSDRHTWPPQTGFTARRVRVVPGGSSVRAGAFLAPTVTMMPPAYVNVGAFVEEGTMIDSHALVGSCAQVGRRVHLSAAAQLGGVLEPVGMRPVIVEDDVLIGGGVGVYEGTLVRQGAVLATGVQLTASVPVYDLVHERILRATADTPLEIPAGAVVVAGSRPVRNSPWGTELGLQLQCALIVKYRDERTDLRAALEGDLR
jgi:2,3,4,5-tetrahydropyridine-2-carboxylate N-succinyltransferase